MSLYGEEKKPKRLAFRSMMGLIKSEIIDSPQLLQEIDIRPIEIATLLRKVA